MLAREPEEVARFLAKTQGLNKTMIGEYLGEREDTCLRVMHAFVDAMDFSGAAFDQAIRYGAHSTLRCCESVMIHETVVTRCPASCFHIIRR